MESKSGGGSAKEPEQTSGFPFLKLPAEIRVTIFRYLLVKADPISLRVGPKRISTKPGSKRRERQVLPVTGLHSTVMRVCRIFHSEGSHLLYGNNIFYFDTTLTKACFLYHFYVVIGKENGALVRHIITRPYDCEPLDRDEAKDLAADPDATDQHYTDFVIREIRYALMYFPLLKDFKIDITAFKYRFRVDSRLRCGLSEIMTPGSWVVKFLGLADEELNNLIAKDLEARNAQPSGKPPSNRGESSASNNLDAVGCVDGSHTTKRAFDAAPDVIATPKELLRDMMELLSDPHLKSLILIRSPTDLMARLRTLEAESVQQTVHQSKQAAITARQGDIISISSDDD